MAAMGRAATTVRGVIVLAVIAGCAEEGAPEGGADAGGQDGGADGRDGGVDAGEDTQAATCPGPLQAKKPQPLGLFTVRDLYVGNGVGSLAATNWRTGIDGAVRNRVPDPPWLGHPTTSEGPCTLFRPAPECVGCSCPGAPCDDVVSVDVGTVTLTGLVESPLLFEQRVPQGYYFVRGPLATPSSRAGAEVRLEATGGFHAPFEIRALGVGQLEVPEQTVTVESGTSVALEWVPPPVNAPLCMHIELRVGELTWIECTVDDTGAFEIPEELVTQMLDYGPMNTHYVRLSRRTRGATDLEGSEVRLELWSQVELPIDIPGFMRCREGPCPEGMECNQYSVCE